MYVTDFIYDDRLASDYGLAICHISTENNMNIVMGSNLEFETVRHNGNHSNMLINSKYTDVITATFDVIKLKCGNEDDYELTPNEIEFLMKWLGRKENLKFQPLYEDNSLSNIYYMGTFNNIEAITINGKVVGMKLTFTSNSSFGFTDMELEYELEANDDIEIYIDTSEIGYLYPRLDIDILGSGDFNIKNKVDENVVSNVVIKNCVNKEHILLDCNYKIIKSDIGTHKIWNDFEYDWLRLYSSIGPDTLNRITVNLPCKIHLTCALPRKVGIFV